MNTFIFQSVPDRYDLRNGIQVGKNETWDATRYRTEMVPGDIVYFWMGGDADIRGLYGWGRLVSTAYLKKDWDSHGVDVSYEMKFRKPILARTIRSNPLLKSMLIFRAPQATNFLLSLDESEHLAGFVKSNGEQAPSFEGSKP